jgi:hypothetical protein
MSKQASLALNSSVDRTVVPVAGKLLQRQCACGQHSGSGECEECRKRREGALQRSAIHPSPVPDVPPIVDEVLHSPGQPLDANARAFMEPRFGHDFSRVALNTNRSVSAPLTIGAPHDEFEQEAEKMAHRVMSQSAASADTKRDFSKVRIHTDGQAAESARAVNALAYTVGNDIVFGAGQYRPNSAVGEHLLAHELTHVVQQSQAGKNVQRQTPSTITPATERDRREFIRDTIEFLNRSADFYSIEQVAITQAVFERVINSWYSMVINQERMIDDQLGGDALLRRDLRAAYTAAIRVLIPKAARAFGRTEADLYRENRGRIPMWAWSTPHHLELGISTPIAEGRSVDILTGEVAFAANSIQVAIAPDASDPALGDRAETRINLHWEAPRYHWEARGRNRIVTSIDPAPAPTARIQTFYGSGITSTSTSGYGRGTTPEDIAGGRVTPRSTSVGFHEGSHGLDYVEFLQNNPPPQFTGRVGMTEQQYQAAITQYRNAWRDYERRAREFSEARTDCVGTTIDQFNQARAAARTTITLVCPPARGQRVRVP